MNCRKADIAGYRCSKISQLSMSPEPRACGAHSAIRKGAGIFDVGIRAKAWSMIEGTRKVAERLPQAVQRRRERSAPAGALPPKRVMIGLSGIAASWPHGSPQ
jgi:hypothetical protein